MIQTNIATSNENEYGVPQKRGSGSGSKHQAASSNSKGNYNQYNMTSSQASSNNDVAFNDSAYRIGGQSTSVATMSKGNETITTNHHHQAVSKEN